MQDFDQNFFDVRHLQNLLINECCVAYNKQNIFCGLSRDKKGDHYFYFIKESLLFQTYKHRPLRVLSGEPQVFTVKHI